MPLQGFARAVFAQQGKALVEPLDLRFGFGEMLFEQFAKLIEAGGLRHFGQRLDQLLLGMKDVAQLVDQKLAEFPRRLRVGELSHGRARLAVGRPTGRRAIPRIPSRRPRSTDRAHRSRRDRRRRSNR